MLSTLRDLRTLFFWLAHLPGFKSLIGYHHADCLNLSDKGFAVARALREKPVPTLAQVHHVFADMRVDTTLWRRDRALLAFAGLTGAQVAALASFRLVYFDLVGGLFEKDSAPPCPCPSQQDYCDQVDNNEDIKTSRQSRSASAISPM